MASDLDRGDSPRARTRFISTVGLLLINDTSSPPCRTCQRSTSIAWNDAWNLLRPCSAFAEWVPTYVWVGVTALCSLEAWRQGWLWTRNQPFSMAPLHLSTTSLPLSSGRRRRLVVPAIEPGSKRSYSAATAVRSRYLASPKYPVPHSCS